MRVYVDPLPDTLSKAMHRTAEALRRYAPRDVQLSRTPEDADVQVLHGIGPDVLDHLRAPSFALLQYCLSTGGGPAAWTDVWTRALFTWSYYDLLPYLPSGVSFLHTPLGVDGHTFRMLDGVSRYVGIVSSGFVSGASSEAIEEVAEAALRCGMSVFHLGPQNIVGMAHREEPTWHWGHDIEDEELAGVYARARWVSGLRHVEGFELPVVEGLACGARPIVFDRPDMRQWYAKHAIFIPESDGEELVGHLVGVLQNPPVVVSAEERLQALARFNWARMAISFWAMLQSRISEEAHDGRYSVLASEAVS